MKDIVQFLRSEMTFWTFRKGFVVARPVMRSKDLPEGVIMAQRKVVGARKVVRAQRRHSNRRFYTAFWPEDNLQEITAPRISCVVSGTADFLLGKSVVRCPRGTVIIIPPRVPHQRLGPFLQGTMRKNGACSLMHAYGHRHDVLFWLSSSHCDIHLNSPSNSYMMSNVALARLLSTAVEEAANDDIDAKAISHNCLNAFFTMVAREIEKQNYVSWVPQDDQRIEKQATNNFTEDVQEYIEAHCHHRIKAGDVARHMCMSDSLFFLKMRENKINFTELVTHYRMEFACRLLRDSDLTVRVINSKLGYKSATYFQNLFRARMNCTPLEYRHASRSRPPEKKIENHN